MIDETSTAIWSVVNSLAERKLNLSNNKSQAKFKLNLTLFF